MYGKQYPQRICLTRIYSYDEYPISYVRVFVMSNNPHGEWVWRDRFQKELPLLVIFLGIFLESIHSHQEPLCLRCRIHY